MADSAGMALFGMISSCTLAGSTRVSAPDSRSEITRVANLRCEGVMEDDAVSIALRKDF